MKKMIGAKKISSLFLAALIAGNVLLCSCDKAETTETTEEPTTTTTTETTEETTTEPAFVTYGNPKDSTPYEEIKLDGVKEHTFTATDYCYIESDKYIVFMEKDIKIPGDLIVNLDAIINEIERQLGVSSCPDSIGYKTVNDIMRAYYEPKNAAGLGPNPWQDWDIGSKIPIFLVVDREDKALISVADKEYCIICLHELFSDELWDSIPSYKDNAWRKSDFVDYSTFAHELTHVVTLRNCELTNIMTEGIAEYMGYSVTKALSDEYPSMKEVLEKNKYNWEDGGLPAIVSEKNVEKIFVEDYHTLSAAERGPEYYYGKRLWQFIYTTYGDDCFVKYCNRLKMNGQTKYNYAVYDKDTVNTYKELLKEEFGNDVFTKFAKWCKKHKYLQTKRL